jgi:hypothetical protein
MISSGRGHADRLDQRVNKALLEAPEVTRNSAEQNIPPELRIQQSEERNYH